MGRKEGVEATWFAMLIWGVGKGLLLRGGDGIGSGGSISSGMCSISLLRLRERLARWLLPAGFLV